jgi:hypothetical protein
MDIHDSIHEWAAELRRHLPLSRPQAWVLAAWSIGVGLLQAGGQTRVSLLLGALLDRKAETMRQRLREFCYEPEAKRGRPRRAVEVEGCFAGLLGWVLERWEGRRLALALDATSLKQDFVVLTLSVLFRSTAIPVAWRVVRGGQPGAWAPHWKALLARVGEGMPRDYFVLVLTDRGLYAPWLFEAIGERGWHPVMRINEGGFFTPEGEAARPLAELVPRPGTSYRGRGTAFKENPIACTLVAHWDKRYKEPWRVLTDLAPEEAEASWYGLRGWIEQGFKDTKGGGFQWQHTRMTDPARVQRFWLVLAVTALRQVSLGGAAEDEEAAGAPPSDRPQAATPPEGPAARRRPRRASVFLRGAVRLMAQLLRGTPGTGTPRLIPEPWPSPFAAAPPIPP